ncbi:hypothetical protein [Novosphingobium sp. 9U]|uniref:hypothetical protein n=1 Tax=Novosphingobium sp. 9U TaxID=2653158 RepID=UPI001F363504|nr:hypothetical protein [Novosphingobium sp. 9U]
MVEDVGLVEKLSIYVPTIVRTSAIQDCAPHFTNHEVVQGIFNEVLTANSSRPGPLVLKKSNGRIFCRMHLFAKNLAGEAISANELSVHPFSEGTICTIQPSALRACEARSGASRAYFRLRIAMPANNDGNPFVEDVPVYDRFLLSGYDQIEYLDFRLNEARTLPTAVEQRMASDQPPGAARMSLVAFLTAVPVSAELSVANTEFHKMRLLEYPIWSAYAPGLPTGMVVYHWKRSARPRKPIVDFSAFVKLQTRRSGRKTLVQYLGFAFLFGIAGNLAAGWLQPQLGPMIAAVWTGLSSVAAHIGALAKSLVTLGLSVWRKLLCLLSLMSVVR